MNRPRNRQSKPQRDNRDGGRGSGRGGRGGFSNSPRPDYKPVPNAQQVVRGATVSIVLKQDQPTGREVQGTVQDLLSRGDHPRGIKVRLTDGRIGRVQRMVQDDGSFVPNAQPSTMSTTSRRVYDVREDDQAGPPPRTLADFMPDDSDDEGLPQSGSEFTTFTSATAKCPICGLFEGDEIAVSRHVDEHLT